MKKRLIKKIGDWCYECKRPMKIKFSFGENDPFIGYYEAKGKYTYCPICKQGWISYTLGINQEKEFQKKAAELLLKNYPPDKYEYLSEEEVFQTQRKKITDEDDLLYKDEDLLRHLRYFVFNTVWERKRIYLKKSFDIYLTNRKGWFDITKPEKE